MRTVANEADESEVERCLSSGYTYCARCSKTSSRTAVNNDEIDAWVIQRLGELGSGAPRHLINTSRGIDEAATRASLERLEQRGQVVSENVGLGGGVAKKKFVWRLAKTAGDWADRDNGICDWCGEEGAEIEVYTKDGPESVMVHEDCLQDAGTVEDGGNYRQARRKRAVHNGTCSKCGQVIMADGDEWHTADGSTECPVDDWGHNPDPQGGGQYNQELDSWKGASIKDEDIKFFQLRNTTTRNIDGDGNPIKDLEKLAEENGADVYFGRADKYIPEVCEYSHPEAGKGTPLPTELMSKWVEAFQDSYDLSKMEDDRYY